MTGKLTLPYFDGSAVLRQSYRARFWVSCGLLCLGLFVFYDPYESLKAYVEYRSDLHIADTMLKKIDTTQIDSKTCQLQVDALLETLKFIRTRPGADDALSGLKRGDSEKAYALLMQAPDEMVMHLGLLEFFSHAEKSISWYQRAVSIDPDNAYAWNQLGILYRRITRLVKAEEIFGKVLAIGETRGDQALIALGYGNLGHVYRVRGDLKSAELYFQKALSIQESLNDKYGMASGYANLATVFRLKNDLISARNFYARAVKLEKELNSKIGIANQLGNLGNVYLLAGDLELAEDKHMQALELDRQLDRQAGLADDFNSLGSIYLTAGDYEAAKRMYLEALKIDLDLDRKNGMADDYGNLGIAYQYLGALDDAENALKRSLWLNSELDNKNNLAIQYGNLGYFYHWAKNDAAQAEPMYQKSLSLFKELGNAELTGKTQKLIDVLHDGSSNSDVYY